MFYQMEDPFFVEKSMHLLSDEKTAVKHAHAVLPSGMLSSLL